MASISDWIGVFLIFMSLLTQLYVMIYKQINKINQLYFLIIMQMIIILAAIFWIIYVFTSKEIYWQTGISNIIIEIFTIIFTIITFTRMLKAKKENINH